MDMKNRNSLWANIFVTELIKQGLRAVCLAAGARSTPLTLAFASSKEIQVYSHIDERSAAYFALGIAKASYQPVALVCTSGTAAANFYPAVIEANYAQIPLLILTADRPLELRDSGSNQSIDQVRLFGQHVRWFMDVIQPEAQPDQHLIRSLKTVAAKAWTTAQMPVPGPVHLNFPFRKPLEPTDVSKDIPAWIKDNSNDTRSNGTVISRGELTPSKDQIEQITARISQAKRGLIVCGPEAGNSGFAKAVTNLAKITGYPIMADALSGVRFGEHTSSKEVTYLAGYENYLQSRKTSFNPQLILRFGNIPISKALADSLANLPNCLQIQITGNGRWRDDQFCIDQIIWANPEKVCDELVTTLIKSRFEPTIDNWDKSLREIDAYVWETAPEWGTENNFEGSILIDVVNEMPPKSTLYIGNSLAVRHLDQFVAPNQKSIRVLANRGASGIDGLISSALGASTVLDQPTVLVVGDLSFYHDLTGLMALKRYELDLTIVLINNDGGGLFHRLPISNFEDSFSEFFLTPHGLEFEPLIRAFGGDYASVENREEFKVAFKNSLQSKKTTVIEIASDASIYEKKRQEFIGTIQAKYLEIIS